MSATEKIKDATCKMGPEMKEKSSTESAIPKPTADCSNSKSSLEIPSEGSGVHLPPSESQKTEIRNFADTSNKVADEKTSQGIFRLEEKSVEKQDIVPVHVENDDFFGTKFNEETSKVNEDSEIMEEEFELKWDDDEDDIKENSKKLDATIEKNLESDSTSQTKLTDKEKDKAKVNEDSESIEEEFELKWDDDENDIKENIKKLDPIIGENLVSNSIIKTKLADKEKDIINDINAQIAKSDNSPPCKIINYENNKDINIYKDDSLSASEKTGTVYVEKPSTSFIEKGTMSSVNREKNNVINTSNLGDRNITVQINVETKDKSDILKENEYIVNVVKDKIDNVKEKCVRNSNNIAIEMEEAPTVTLANFVNKDDTKTITDVEVMEVNAADSSAPNISNKEQIENILEDSTSKTSQLKDNLEEMPVDSKVRGKSSEVLDISDINSSSDLEHTSSSFIARVDHRVNEPNIMTEIPTQESIDITDDSFEDSVGNRSQNMSIDHNTAMKNTDLIEDNPKTTHQEEMVCETLLPIKFNTHTEDLLLSSDSIKTIPSNKTNESIFEKLITEEKLDLSKDIPMETGENATLVQENKKLQEFVDGGEKVAENDRFLIDDGSVIGTQNDQQSIEELTEPSKEKSSTPKTHENILPLTSESEIVPPTELKETDSKLEELIEPQVAMGNKNEITVSNSSTTNETLESDAIPETLLEDNESKKLSKSEDKTELKDSDKISESSVSTSQIVDECLKTNTVDVLQLKSQIPLKSDVVTTTESNVLDDIDLKINKPLQTEAMESTTEATINILTHQLTNKPSDNDADIKDQSSTVAEKVDVQTLTPQSHLDTDITAAAKMTETCLTTSQFANQLLETKADLTVQTLTSELSLELDVTAQVTEIPFIISQVANKPSEINVVVESSKPQPPADNAAADDKIHPNKSQMANKPLEIKAHVTVQPLSTELTSDGNLAKVKPTKTNLVAQHSDNNSASEQITEMKSTISHLPNKPTKIDVVVKPLTSQMPSETDNTAGDKTTEMQETKSQLINIMDVDVQPSKSQLPSETDSSAGAVTTEIQLTTPQLKSKIDVDLLKTQLPSKTNNTAEDKITEMQETTSILISKMDVDVQPSKSQLPSEIDNSAGDVTTEIQPTTSQLTSKIDVALSKPQLPSVTDNTVGDKVTGTGETTTQVIDKMDVDVQPSKSQRPSETDNSVGDKITETQPTSLSITSQPTISQSAMQPIEMTADVDDTNDAADATDSLGLLAECSRVSDDDDEPEQETSEHDEDDDDFDPDDDSSNQMVEQSEDSAQHSESDAPKTPAVNLICKEISLQDLNEKSPLIDQVFNFEISNVKGHKGESVDQNICEEMEVTTNDDDVTTEETEDITESPAVHESVEIAGVDEQADSNDKPEFRMLKDLLLGETKAPKAQPSEETDLSKKSPTKTKKKLEISPAKNVVNIVDLEESSSDDEIQEIIKDSSKQGSEKDVTSVNISSEIEVMSSGGNTSDMKSQQGDTVITIPKPQKLKTQARLNTSEVTITTASSSERTLVIPETKVGEEKTDSAKSKFNWEEIFNLDSDEEDTTPAKVPTPPPEKAYSRNKCVNMLCTSDSSVEHFTADEAILHYYHSDKKTRLVCRHCALVVAVRAQGLINGVRDFTPLLQMDMGRDNQQLVEILDSDSDDEGESEEGQGGEKIGEGVQKLGDKLANMLNETWIKFKMDARLKETEDQLTMDLEKLEKEGLEVNAMLDECQTATDKLRCELYAAFEGERMELVPLVIVDTPDSMFAYLEPNSKPAGKKRRLSSETEMPAKKPAIPLGFTSNDTEKTETDKADTSTTEEAKPESPETSKMDDDKDVSVVTLSAEAAPASLPAPGELAREPLRAGLAVYAMRNAYGSWLKAKIWDRVLNVNPQQASQFTMCRVRFEARAGRSLHKILPARCLAYCQPPTARMTIGTRVIALFKANSDKMNIKRDSFYSGVVAEIPNPVNKYRYLVFFDDGYAQYVQHADTRLVCEFSSLVWEEVHPFSREFVREYLLAYPERPMVRLHTGQSLKTEWNGKWWTSKVIEVDASLVKVHFEQDDRTEWIYRGSTRLAPLYLERQAAGKTRLRPLPRNRAHTGTGTNMPYVEYTRSEEQDATKAKEVAEAHIHAHQEEMRRQRAVAKKSTVSTVPAPQPAASTLDQVTSRVVYYTPKNAIRPHKLVTHNCGPYCKRTDVLALKDLRTYNPLAKPLLSGWERQIVRFKGHKEVTYRAPCGRRLRDMPELHKYLQRVQSDMGVDLFDFNSNTHCLAEFVLNKCIVGKKDLSHGKENVPVPCVNYYDDSLPEFCSYNTERTPTAGVPLNLDPEFLCGCDCADDCQDKTKCACWKMTLEGARTIGLDGDVGYSYKRLPEPLPSGIYECNSRCKCKSTCLNRVAQHPLQLKLQVFKTLNRGWGIRALNDVPKGSFLCIYAGNLLTDATANLDGLNEGDEYLAELDYIEVVEQMKEGYEDDIPEQDKKLDKKESNRVSESESTESESEEETPRSEMADGDFEVSGYIPGTVTEFSKRLRGRDKEKKEKKNAESQKKDKDGNRENEDDFITISDDEELREPARFAAQAGMGSGYISKYRSVRSLFGQDEACYIMDAKVQGNIGRYLNHSCSPNVFVQNVFVDTHDPRFPWVAFFALSHIRAGTELTWNYNYDVGSVPGKALYCYCGAANCRGRLL